MSDSVTNIDDACTGIADPAEVLAASVRISGRLCWAQPQIARFLVGAGLDALDAESGLAPRARRDIQAGLDAGRFHTRSAELVFSALAGSLLGLLRLRLGDSGTVDEAAVDWLAEVSLRMLGVVDAEAARIAALPLVQPSVPD